MLVDMGKNTVKVDEEELDILSRPSEPETNTKKYGFYKIAISLLAFCILLIILTFFFINKESFNRNAIIITQKTYLRENKTIESAAITTLEKRTKVTVINNTNENWVKVKYGTLTGWVKRPK